MNIFNESFLPIMQKYIEQIRESGNEEFRTTDVIKRYMGYYIVNNTYPNESINANIGKFLKENEDSLRIKEIASEQSVKDEKDRLSKTSVWKFV